MHAWMPAPSALAEPEGITVGARRAGRDKLWPNGEVSRSRPLSLLVAGVSTGDRVVFCQRARPRAARVKPTCSTGRALDEAMTGKTVVLIAH